MRKLSAIIFSVIVAAGILTACGANKTGDTVKTREEGDKVITVAASATPHAEILEAAKPILAEQGWDLQVTVFDDYVQQNLVVSSHDFNANFFQHQPYLDDFNAEKGTKLVSVAAIHYEPLGIYPGTEKDIANISEGATVAVPNDPTNEARALMLLETNGVIVLKEDAGLKATVKDIAENPKNIEILELEAAQVSRVKEEVAFVVLNGNYALQAGLSAANDAVAFEEADSKAAVTYGNILVVNSGNEQDAGVQALLAVLKSEEITNFINETYKGAVIALK